MSIFQGSHHFQGNVQVYNHPDPCQRFSLKSLKGADWLITRPGKSFTLMRRELLIGQGRACGFQFLWGPSRTHVNVHDVHQRGTTYPRAQITAVGFAQMPLRSVVTLANPWISFLMFIVYQVPLPPEVRVTNFCCWHVLGLWVLVIFSWGGPCFCKLIPFGL